MESRIHEAPTDGGVDELTIAALKAALRLQGDEWCAAHALDTTRDHDLGIANGNGVRCGGERLQAGAAESIHRLPWNLNGVSGN